MMTQSILPSSKVVPLSSNADFGYADVRFLADLCLSRLMEIDPM
jgi:hypothetical protein